MFKAPSHGIPDAYQNRISYVGNLSFVIEGIQFSDKFLKVFCILNYKNGSLTKHVESNVYEIKFVYGMFRIWLFNFCLLSTILLVSFEIAISLKVIKYVQALSKAQAVLYSWTSVHEIVVLNVGRK